MEGKSNILEKIFAVEGNRCSGKPVKNFRGTVCVCVCGYLIGVVTLIRSPLIEFLGCLSG